MPTAAIVSFRLGGGDGVAVEAAKWGGALEQLGWTVMTIAGSGPVDVQIAGLALHASEPPDRAHVEHALAPADLVIVENLCSLPLNPAAGAVVADVLAGRPAVLHHHDLPWQRAHLAHLPGPPDNPAWAHVTINRLSQSELAQREITASVIYNTFDPDPDPGDRAGARTAIGVAADTRLILQPTRALARKNIAGGLALAAGVGGTYWLMGPAEDGYGPELERLVEEAPCPVVLGAGGPPVSIADAYAASDAVVLPSTWEGFGNPSIESATHRKPLAIGPYPVAGELRAFGFEWFDSAVPGPLADWLDRRGDGRGELLSHNHDVAARHFNLAMGLERLPTRFR
jgi:glycosyltransferase involved in cell wall biosynthesis